MLNILHVLISVLLSFAPIPSSNTVIWNSVSVNNVSHHIAIDNYDAFMFPSGNTIICDPGHCYKITDDTISYIEWQLKTSILRLVATI